MLTKVLGNWQAESQSLTAAGQVACNDILPIVDWIERLLLNREQVLDSAGDKLLGRGSHDLWEAGELSILDSVALHIPHGVLLTSQTGFLLNLLLWSCLPILVLSFALFGSRVHSSTTRLVLLLLALRRLHGWWLCIRRVVSCWLRVRLRLVVLVVVASICTLSLAPIEDGWAAALSALEGIHFLGGADC